MKLEKKEEMMLNSDDVEIKYLGIKLLIPKIQNVRDYRWLLDRIWQLKIPAVPKSQGKTLKTLLRIEAQKFYHKNILKI